MNKKNRPFSQSSKLHINGLNLVKKSILTGALSLMLAACGSDPIPLSDAPLAGATIGGEFSLTDQNGKKRSYSEFDGQYRIVYFGYTSCPDICSPDMQNLMAGLIEFEQEEPKLAEKIQPLFISVDPKRDTADILTQFTAAFHPRLLGLRGSEEEIAETASKFAVVYEKVPPTADAVDPENNYLMGHSQIAYLMGPSGEPLALLPLNDPNTEIDEGTPKMVMAELAKWVR